MCISFEAIHQQNADFQMLTNNNAIRIALLYPDMSNLLASQNVALTYFV